MDILIIDDEQPICEAMADLLGKEGYECAWETDARAGVAAAKDAALVLLDLMLPGVVGLELLDELLLSCPKTPVIMVTAHGTVEVAVEAMKRGAHDFIVKPPNRADLLLDIERALRVSDARFEASELCFDLPEEVVLRDPRSAEILGKLQEAAPTDLPVLLEGETGVGKEVFAHLIHRWSDRRDEPFVRINCAAIPENLFESELFGHEEGAFTGATVAKPGRVELADGGVLFLDEIGELPLTSQAKLLQFLQDRTFERVGGLRTLRSDVRLITATNRDLSACVEEKTFRQDLLFRIRGLPVRIPPLRERREDIAALARHFLARFREKYGKDAELAPGALETLCGYEWPGNVRELEHAMARAVALCGVATISPGEILPDAPEIPAADLRAQRKEFERAQVVQALDRTGGNRTRAAEVLGISRRMLQKKLKAYGIN